MEDVISFDVTDPSLGTLDIDELFNSQFTYETPGAELIRLPEEDESQPMFASKFLETSFKEDDGSVQSPHNSILADGSDDAALVNMDYGINWSDIKKGIETNFNTASEDKDVEAEKQRNSMMHVKLLFSKLEERDETILSFMNEIEVLKKKVSDQEVMINKMNEQVSNLKYEIKKCTLEIKVNSLQMGLLCKQNINVKGELTSDGSNDNSNGVQAAGSINKNENDNSIVDDGITTTDAMREAKIADNDDDLMMDDDRESSDAYTEVEEKVMRRKFKCLLCHKCFLTKGKLNTHRRIHTDERPYPCCVCKQSFRERKHLKEHISRLHKLSPDGNTNIFVRRPGSEGFRCCFCLQLMKSREVYRTHISDFHTDLLPMIH